MAPGGPGDVVPDRRLAGRAGPDVVARQAGVG
jgi:hypothetical protein